MEQYIKKSALVAEIERRINKINPDSIEDWRYRLQREHDIEVMKNILSLINTLEVKEMDYNNGWIDCLKQMPKESKQWSDTLQGHREWTESNSVLAWDSMYGCRVDATRNGKWMSECKGGCTGQIVHGIIAWRPIPEFSEELLLKTHKGE